MSETQKKDILTTYVPLIIVAIGAAITWGTFMTRVSDADARIGALEVSQSQVSNTLTAIQVDVGSIKTSVSYIEKAVK